MGLRFCLGLACSTALALVSPRIALSDSPPLPILSWGGYGSGPGQFYYPQGIAVDATGRVYVVDSNNGRIEVFNRTGGFLFQWGTIGSGDGQFQQPIAIAVDPAGNVYVTEASNPRVQKFTGEGAYLTQWGTSGSGPGQFYQPAGIAADASGHVFVADPYAYRVQKFTDTGGYLTEWGGYGGEPGHFTNPNGVATDADGNVYVTDTYSHRVEKFSGAGAFLTQWGSYGSGEGQFAAPIGIAVSDSAVYVVEQGNHRAQKFTPDGAFILKWGSQGGTLGRFNSPYGVALDDSGNVYITDTGSRVQKFGHRETVRIEVPGNFSRISDAITAAGYGDTIVVAPGIYYEQVNTAGKAMVLASRFLDTGDPTDIENTVIDSQGYGIPLTCSSGEEASTRIVGFTLRNGQGYFGGGFVCSSSSPRLEHLIIRDNSAQVGGGVFVGFGGFPELMSCTIAHNRANTGAGIYCYGSAVLGTPTERCNVFDNWNTSTPDQGADFYGLGSFTTAYLDTFTTLRPDEAQISPFPGGIHIDALHAFYPDISESDIYVATTGDNANDGLTPGTALKNVFAAMVRAAPTLLYPITIHVAAGVYSPSLLGERTLHPRSLVTVAGEDSGTTIVDGDGRLQMVYCFQDHSVELSDLTFRNGIMSAGAIHLEQTSANLVRCVIRDHASTYGPGNAGIYFYNSPTGSIRDCRISGNQGVGIACEQMSDPDILDNVLSTNYQGGVTCSGSSPHIRGNWIEGHPQGSGSGIDVHDGSHSLIEYNTIVGNHSPRGGGIAVSYADPVIHGNGIFGNVASSGYGDHGGGGIWCQYTSGVIDSNLFQGNQAIGSLPDGGAMYCRYLGPTITRNQFLQNSARDTAGYLFAIGRGGAIFLDGSSPLIGGAAEMGNTFVGNLAVVGADLCSVPLGGVAQATIAPNGGSIDPRAYARERTALAVAQSSGVVVAARFNHFRVYPPTPYFVSPLSGFDLSQGAGDLAPLTQDAYVAPGGDDANAGTSTGAPLRTLQSALSRLLATAGTPLTIHVGPGTYSPSRTGERFPLPMSSHLSLRGSGSSKSILDAEGTSSVIVCDGVNSLTISGLRIQGGRAGAGGGVFCRASACSLVNNTIRGNSASLGGGIYCTQGGDPVIANNQIVMNRASGPNYFARIGGGVAANDHSNPVLINNVIALNIAGDQGGGLVFWNWSTGRLVNNTIAFNLANGNGGAMNLFDSPVEIRNSILYNNVSGDGSQISGGTPTTSYSDIEGGSPGTGNLNLDPFFDEAAFLHLGIGSPCIDGGDPAPADHDPEDPLHPGFASLPALGTTRNDMGAYGGPGAAGQSTDIPTPALVSLRSASASPEGVRLTWYGAFGNFSGVTVQRRTLDGEWKQLGPATVGGTGAITFFDTEVVAGATFLYRLEYRLEGLREFTDEVLIRVPVTATLALRGLRPNPAVRALVVDFTLPTRGAARLELLDVTGRRVLGREVGQLGVGRHLVEIARAEQLAPGLYFLRLSQGARSMTAKAIVAR